MTGRSLKLIACLSMAIDHMGNALFPDQLWMQIVGRLAFPIFAFMVVQGMQHTRSPMRYIRRLLVTALCSEVLFDLLFFGTAVYPLHQNTLFTLALGVLALWLHEHSRSQWLSFLPAIAAELLFCDYGAMGVLLILLWGKPREGEKRWMALMMLSLAFSALSVIEGLSFWWATLQLWSLLALPLLARYKGQAGGGFKTSKLEQVLHYAFYPLHLLVIYGIQCA